MTAAVKYCGGCNPRYDRTGALAELKAALPGVRFVPAAPGQAADALLVLAAVPPGAPISPAWRPACR